MNGQIRYLKIKNITLYGREEVHGKGIILHSLPASKSSCTVDTSSFCVMRPSFSTGTLFSCFLFEIIRTDARCVLGTFMTIVVSYT